MKPRGQFDHDQFSKILAYYRECLRYDADRSVVLHAEDEGRDFLALQLTSEWTLSGEGELSAELVGKNAMFASELRQRQSSAEVMYGYPILAKRSWNGTLEFLPVFLQPVQYDLNHNKLTARLLHDWPDINRAFLQSIGVQTREQETQLYEELGLSADAELPSEGLSYFVGRLAGLPQLSNTGALDPSAIPNGPNFGQIDDRGVLNRHVLVIVDRLRFTAGLERELSTLSNPRSANRIDGTAIRYFFGGVPNDSHTDDGGHQRDDRITEVVSLNDEQRSAVQSAFRNDLTVVTGPPGTGKSQIVTTVIANAWIRQQSVLFASYNQKAVDVVEDRVNSLSIRPLLIRTGRRSGDRDLRNEIINYMANILSSDVSDHDRLELDQTRRAVEQLEEDRTSVWSNLEDVRGCRNRADQLDRKIHALKEEMVDLDGQVVKAQQLRELDEIQLRRTLGECDAIVEQLRQERDAAQNDRRAKVAAINLEIEEKSDVLDYLGREGAKVQIDDDRFDAGFAEDLRREINELELLEQRRGVAIGVRDAKITSLKRRRGRLNEEFDLHQWSRQQGQDFTAIGKSILEAQSILQSQVERGRSIWLRIWNRWRRSGEFKRVNRLADTWADEYDILGAPPSVPLSKDGLERWMTYLSAASTRLSEWERDARRNSQLVKEIDDLKMEIVEVDAEFDRDEFDLREAQLNQRIFERVQAQIESLVQRIEKCRDQIKEVDDAFESMKFEERIAIKQRAIDRLNAEHESKHGSKFAELDASRALVQQNLNRCIREFDQAVAELAKTPMVNDLADELKSIEKQIWDAGRRLVDESMRVLPDHFDLDTRQAIGDFRALFERLTEDQLGGREYGKLMRNMAYLFPKVMSALPAWCVTNLSARGNIPLHPGMFDLVVIDEASQCNIPSAMPLLYRAKRALIIGDPDQLRHITKINPRQDQTLQARNGLNSASDQSLSFKQQSLFDIGVRNVGRNALHSLREHFRSHEDIIGFSNRHWYNDRLLVCTDYSDLQAPAEQNPGIRWHEVNGSVQHSATYNGNINSAEADELAGQVVDLIQNRGFRGSVGIVTPFRAQANLIRGIINRHLEPSEILRCELITDTAHAFQGDEKDVVFFSPCVGFQMPSGAEWFISETDNLFNVAITRARALLVVVGNLEACLSSNIAHVKGFAEFCNNTHQGRDSTDTPASFDDGPSVGHWERPFYDAMTAAGLKPMHQYVEGQYRLDFAFVSDNLKLNVEVDGEGYHRDWDGRQSRSDLMRDHRLMGMGWQIKRFWVYELRDNMERCVAEVKELVG